MASLYHSSTYMTLFCSRQQFCNITAFTIPWVRNTISNNMLFSASLFQLSSECVRLTGSFCPAISVGEAWRGGGCRSPWETRYCSMLTRAAQESAQVWRWTTLLEQRSSKRGWDWRTKGGHGWRIFKWIAGELIKFHQVTNIINQTVILWRIQSSSYNMSPF